jgi:dTDP-4-amino-4,6-dideoxygalactose transaminase|tara:strand:- start:1201 stop:2115 length:915 start_codon:yes stop_codon:yes gene_type:complete
MIQLFNINNYKIDTSELGNVLHGEIVEEFEQAFAEYVGAKYACFANSASSLIYLSLKDLNTTVKIPSIMPPVVPNMIVNSGNKIEFYDDVDWVGNMYRLHPGIWDSAQRVSRNQYSQVAKGTDVMIFSFYPTKPVGSCDGGMIVSDNKYTIDKYKAMVLNGTKPSKNAWEREQIMFGYKMHGSSIQAKIAYENFKKLDDKKSKLNDIRNVFNTELSYNNLSLHLYRIRVKDNSKFIEQMKNVGIQCGIHYKAFHRSPLLKNIAKFKPMPKSEIEEKQTVSIPFHERLTKLEINYIIENIRKFND